MTTHTIAPDLLPAGDTPTPEVGLPASLTSRDPKESVLVQELKRMGEGLAGDQDTLLLMFRVNQALQRAASVSSYLEGVMHMLLAQLDATAGMFFRKVPGDDDPALVAYAGQGLDLGEDPPVSIFFIYWAIT